MEKLLMMFLRLRTKKEKTVKFLLTINELMA